MPAEVLKVSSSEPEEQAIRYAASLISSGQVVGVPTDTFYALAADPFNLSAVQQVYRIKGREEKKALPILVSSIEEAVVLARDLPDSFLKLAKRFWPGALTLVVEASHRIPLKVTGGTGRVALRWPDSSVACAVIQACGTPITGTSANISGFPPCSSAEQLLKQLGSQLPLILDVGDTGASLASTIVELRGEDWRILREGVVGEGDIRLALEED